MLALRGESGKGAYLLVRTREFEKKAWEGMNEWINRFGMGTMGFDLGGGEGREGGNEEFGKMRVEGMYDIVQDEIQMFVKWWIRAGENDAGTLSEIEAREKL